MKQTRGLILAAGKGTRMNSDIPKVLISVNGKPMIQRVYEALHHSGIMETGIIVSSQNKQQISEVTGDKVVYIIQENPQGTGHAVMCARRWLEGFLGDIIIVVGDAPFITSKEITSLIELHQKSDNACTLLSAIWDIPPAYGRVIRNADGKFIKIIEERDASSKQKQIKEVSTSHYIFKSKELFHALSKITSNNAQNEYYLPDAVGVLNNEGKKVGVHTVTDYRVTMGINTPEELKKYIKEYNYD